MARPSSRVPSHWDGHARHVFFRVKTVGTGLCLQTEPFITERSRRLRLLIAINHMASAKKTFSGMDPMVRSLASAPPDDEPSTADEGAAATRGSRCLRTWG